MRTAGIARQHSGSLRVRRKRPGAYGERAAPKTRDGIHGTDGSFLFRSPGPGVERRAQSWSAVRLAQGHETGVGRWPSWKRQLVYSDPRLYWTLRGGEDYFREQEGQAARTLRAEWLAQRLAAYRPVSLLEIGCGYGKLLRALRRRLDVPLVGLDFSTTQLEHGRRFLKGLDDIETILGCGERCLLAMGRSTWW